MKIQFGWLIVWLWTISLLGLTGSVGYHVFVDHALSVEYACITPHPLFPAVKPPEAPKQK